MNTDITTYHACRQICELDRHLFDKIDEGMQKYPLEQAQYLNLLEV